MTLPVALLRLLDRRVPGRPAILAHRGASALAPENTLEAARLGLEGGADGWELDVRLTRDGVPVVIHDATLTRTTDVARRFVADERAVRGFRVADFDWGEIRDLDAGFWFIDPSGGHRSARAFGTLDTLPGDQVDRFASGTVRVPSLTEALAWTRDADWWVNVELKSEFGGGSALVDATLRAIAEAGFADRVLISSFDHEDLASLATRESSLALGALTTSPLYDPATYLQRLGAHAYHPSVSALGEAAGPTPPASTCRRDATFGRLRERGVPVLVYTVNDTTPGGLAERLAASGVSGLFTDDPASLVEARRRG